MSRKQNLSLLVGFLLLALALVLGRVSAEEQASSRPATRTHLVRVEPVVPASEGRRASFPGVTRATRRAALSFSVPARVIARSVEIGDEVRTGQIVATLDDSEFAVARRSAAAALAEIEVRLAQARREEDRVEQLIRAKAATTEELESARAIAASLGAARDAASARVEETDRLVREAVLRAPFDGTVTAVEMEPGEWAGPGATVVELAGSGDVEVRIEVPEALRAAIVPGSAVTIELPMSKQSVAGRVVSIANASSGAGSLFPVIVAVDRQTGIVPGLSAEVILPIETSDELSVPLSAVVDSGSSHPSVFRVSDGIARRVAVRPGRVAGDRLTVSGSSLSAGDMVAVLGHTALADGDAVEVR